MSDDDEGDAWGVAASRSRARWSVAAADWQDLPPEVVELLAAPVEVTVVGVPEEEPDHPSPDEPSAVRQGYGECMPSFVAPVALPPLPRHRALAGAGTARRARRRI